jgi:hypothetical protein
MSKKNQIVVYNSSKVRTLAGGALIGACAGIVAAYLLTRRAARQGREVTVTPGEGVQLGMLVFGLLKTIASLGDGK